MRNRPKTYRCFFEQSFDEIPDSTFPELPKGRILDDLTARAAGLFIWAKTMTEVLELGLPEDQLRLIARWKQEKKIISGIPWAVLSKSSSS